jgi:mannonate dehydratase
MKRRDFIKSTTFGAAAIGILPLGVTETQAAGKKRFPMLMKVGHQHDHTPATLKTLAALGVNHICSGRLKSPDEWSVDSLAALKKQVESYGITLAAVPLPLSSSVLKKAEYPEILLAKDPDRDRAIASICEMIRNAGAAGIPLVKYNLTFLGVVRSGRVPGRGNASYSTFVYDQARPETALTEAGPINAEIYWDRITYFLKRVVPVAEEAKVRIALHPQDPGLPKGTGYQGVDAVLSSVDGLKRFIETVPSAYHGLNFCQGTISEMLLNPDQEIHEVIRYFGTRKKIFNVHFRNIKGGFLNFQETFPDNGDVNMPRALKTYREIGFDGMIMPDHVPVIEGDPESQKAYAFCFGYIQALLQVLAQEA